MKISCAVWHQLEKKWNIPKNGGLTYALLVLVQLKVAPLSSDILRRAIKLPGSSLLSWDLRLSCVPAVIIQSNKILITKSVKGHISKLEHLQNSIFHAENNIRKKEAVQPFFFIFPQRKPEWETLFPVTFGLPADGHRTTQFSSKGWRGWEFKVSTLCMSITPCATV